MKRSISILILAAGCLVSCDKARKIAGEATSAVAGQVAKATAGDAAKSEPDPELAKLVDRNDEGAVFRKDLPFPSRIDVRTVTRLETDGRFYQASAIERRAENLKGVRVGITQLSRAGNDVRYTLEQSSFTNPAVEDADGKPAAVADPLAQLAPTSRPRTFHREGGVWRTHDSDGFRAAALSKQLAPVFPALLEENGLAPRPVWFGKEQRIRIGQEIPLRGNSLSMVLAGQTKGTLALRLESFEAVHGHPCGVFSVTGDYSRSGVADFEGNFIDEEVTIQGGRVWLSLIHPVVLKWDLDTIQTQRHGGGGNAASRFQGAIKLSITRDWKTPAK